MTSIFNRVYSYRERERRNNRENFLTEIFAYCIESDKKFRNDFLNLISHPPSELIDVSTQNSYPHYGIPDIQISVDDHNSVILVESKVEHHERENQLNDYKNILIEYFPLHTKYLIYITKYYDSNHYNETLRGDIKFIAIKWENIYNIINNNHSAITSELKKYLKEEDMDDTKNFNFNDLTSLTTITGTILKMDEILNRVRPVYAKLFGSFPATSKATKLIDSWYGVSDGRFSGEIKYWINTGFSWGSEDGLVYAGIDLWIPKEATTLIEKLKKILRITEEGSKTGEWVQHENGNGITIENHQYLSNFITEYDEQIPAIANYFNQLLQDIANSKIE